MAAIFEIARSATVPTLAPMDLAEWIDKGLKKPGKSASALARRLKVASDKVSKMRSGVRQPQARELPIIEAYLEERAPIESVGFADEGDPFGTDGQVPVVGYVGDGAEVHHYAVAQSRLDRVHAPASATDATVALQVRTDSLGVLFDRWFVFYDQLSEKMSPQLEGRLSVVEIPGGRVLVTKPVATKRAGVYELLREQRGRAVRSSIVRAARVKFLMGP